MVVDVIRHKHTGLGGGTRRLHHRYMVLLPIKV